MMDPRRQDRLLAIGYSRERGYRLLQRSTSRCAVPIA
jgi:hypothetical protein